MKNNARQIGRAIIMLLIIGQALTASTAVSATTLSTELVMDGFSEPVFLTSPPGDTTRLFIVEKGGTIKIIKNGALLPQAFLDISGQISSYSERGLLGLAFHPDYAENGYFYVTANYNWKTVIRKYLAALEK